MKRGPFNMKVSKLLLAVVVATVLVGALAASASARNFEVTWINSDLWTNVSFTGGFGVVECEIKLSGSIHARTIAKSVGSLIGYVTEGTVLRCARGGATIRQESLPWHRRYRSFSGTLPSITGLSETITGAEWQVREPFGISCTVRRETSSTIRTYRIFAGHFERAELSGRSPCSGIEGTLSGGTFNVGLVTISLI
jgi:hypothetical protein